VRIRPLGCPRGARRAVVAQRAAAAGVEPAADAHRLAGASLVHVRPSVDALVGAERPHLGVALLASSEIELPPLDGGDVVVVPDLGGEQRALHEPRRVAWSVRAQLHGDVVAAVRRERLDDRCAADIGRAGHARARRSDVLARRVRRAEGDAGGERHQAGDERHGHHPVLLEPGIECAGQIALHERLQFLEG